MARLFESVDVADACGLGAIDNCREDIDDRRDGASEFLRTRVGETILLLLRDDEEEEEAECTMCVGRD